MAQAYPRAAIAVTILWPHVASSRKYLENHNAMPLLDLPLEQLRQYQGRNPRPDGFDAFWDRALSELDHHNAQPELVPHTINAPFAQCFSLFFSAPDGSRLHPP